MSEDNTLQAFGITNRTKPSKRNTEAYASPTPTSTTESEQEKIYKVIKIVTWAVCGVNVFKPVADTSNQLAPGIYNIVNTQEHGIIFKKKELRVDDLLLFPDSLSDKIMKEIMHFWSCGDRFKKHGFLHRRGYMLYGPAGSGKTCLVHQIMNNIIESGGIVFQCDSIPNTFSTGLQLFRQVEPFRPTVCLFEDLDAIIESSSEDTILSLLDGENQIDKALNVATTNYPERMDKRIVGRPRRFDRVILIDMPPPEVRELYFREKLKITDEDELSTWVKVSDRFSFAALAEIVISVKCFDKSLEESANNLRRMSIDRISSTQYNDLKNNSYSNQIV